MASQTTHSIGILIHGCHLQAEGKGFDWHKLVFGTAEEPGRVPHALELLFVYQKVEDVKLLFWGTGASKITLDDGTEELESQHTYRLATTTELPWMAARIGREAEEVLSLLQKISYIDKKTQNTSEEVRVAVKQCKKREIEVLISVSSTSHIQRCLTDLVTYNKERQERLFIMASPSATGFGDTLMLEAPHRGAQRKPPEELYPNVIGRKMLKLMKDFDLYVEYLEQWNQLTDDFARRLTVVPKSA
ncbi:MAG: hypothetical protein V4492_06520 [Chlamydiota bacterium]